MISHVSLFFWGGVNADVVDGARSLSANVSTLVRMRIPQKKQKKPGFLVLRSYGVDGVRCSRCTNNRFLRDGRECVSQCRDGETAVGTGIDGRECQ